jgi:hypothetical protein
MNMEHTDKKDFALLIAGVMAYHRQPCSDALIHMYWRGCQQWELAQVGKAIDQLTRDAEAGKFPPKIGDITRMLEGTHTDRSQIAWGKALGAMQSVGAYTDVIFDDAAIHAVVEDMGGWPKLCRTELKDLGYVQHRFCESHRAYTSRGKFEYQKRLPGERSSDAAYMAKGLPVPSPALVGDMEACAAVYESGNASGKTAIDFSSFGALEAISQRRQPAQNDLRIEAGRTA